MKHVLKGDLIRLAKAGKFDLIVHGCCCFNKWGKDGIAPQIRRAFPLAYKADMATEEGDEGKMGDISFHQYKKLTVVNAYIQWHYTKVDEGQVMVHYNALRMAFRTIRLEFPDKRIGYPKIGAGWAGGDWDRIAWIINDELEGEDHTYVEYEKAPREIRGKGRQRVRTDLD